MIFVRGISILLAFFGAIYILIMMGDRAAESPDLIPVYLAGLSLVIIPYCIMRMISDQLDSRKKQ
ncbi:hypothetical protein [Pantoea ananatis]|uniref:hypothetical protein n=1 Tax=Pantoea ananas TaxID=553 RepID=UPI001B30E25F|nr:hypothetical protein [Pantoea ananatis]